MRRALVVLLLLAPAVANAAAPVRAHRPTVHAPAHAPAKPAEDARSRTLDDIHIEGEIPVPQVLFITARDQRRFLEFQHHRYLRTSASLAAATPLPRLIVVTPSPAPAGKEIAR